MSEAGKPATADGQAPSPPRPRPLLRPIRRGPPPPASAAAGEKKWLGLGPLIAIAAVALLGFHLVRSRAEFSIEVRALLTVPGLLLLWELHRYLTKPGRSEIPFNVVGLLYFYVPFSFAALFNIQFFDISGPVTFSDNARSSAGLAVALGGFGMYAGMRLGEVLGHAIRPIFLGIVPPADLPPAFDKAVLAYAGLNILVLMISVSAPTLIPAALSLVVAMSVSLDLAIVLPILRPELFQGRWSRHLALALMGVGWAFGLLRGTLEPIFRLGLPAIVARWWTGRKLPYALIGVAIGMFILFQPVKRDFRAQVWGRNQTSYTERVEAWNVAFTNFFSREDTQDETETSTISRITELDAVMHAFDMLPGQVQFLDGSGWLVILTGPIPRLIWPDKPTTQDSAEQHYATIFHRQTEQGARTTAIVLPVIVDGYWNFGWPGIPLVCALVGLWVGVCQRLWTGDHWALQALGLVHLSRLIVHAQLNAVYGGLFQSLVGSLLACWALYWLASGLSKQAKAQGQRIGMPAMIRPRAPGRALPR